MAGGGSPTIVDGVLYVGWVRGASAFDATCGAGDAGCAPLWQSPTEVGSVIDLPTVAGGAVYAGAEDGRLYVFGLGGSARFPNGTAVDGSRRGQSPLYGVVYGLLALAVIVWVIRRRRRRDTAPSPEA